MLQDLIRQGRYQERVYLAVCFLLGEESCYVLVVVVVFFACVGG